MSCGWSWNQLLGQESRVSENESGHGFPMFLRLACLVSCFILRTTLLPLASCCVFGNDHHLFACRTRRAAPQRPD
jgi:hypothetical protein